MEQPILPLRDAPVLADAATVWFSRRWGIPAALSVGKAEQKR